MSERWCVVGDGDGHSWLCPADRRQEALEAIEAVDRYWAEADAQDLDPDAMPPEPETPPWLREIDGVHRLTFVDPRTA